MRVFTLALAFVLVAPVAASAADLLYVSLSNNTVVRYDISLSTSQAIANSAQVFVNTNLNSPQGMAFDSLDNFYVTNVDGNTISKFNSSGQFLSTIGSSLNLNNPRGLVIDAFDNIYTANWSASNSITKFDSSGLYQSSITSGLSRPIGLAFDSSGNLYAANDVGSIAKFDSSGGYLTSFSTPGTPNGLAFDSSGNLYAAHYIPNTVSKFNSSGALLSSIGNSSNLNRPMGIAVDSSGNIYVANSGGNSITKFDSSGQALLNWSTGAGIAPGFLLATPVPEPSAYILGIFAALTMAILARRRRRTALP